MKSNRFTLISGFMPPLCMSVMLIFEQLALRGGGVSALAFVLWQILPFLVPSVAMVLTGRMFGINVLPRIRIPHRRYMGFTLCISIAAALMAFLLNCFIARISGASYYQSVSYLPQLESSSLLLMTAAVVLPAVFEELFFRGVLMRALSRGGDITAVIISALCFALCHGSLRNFAGPFAAGLIYGYITYAIGSVWPAVTAHLLNNAFNMTLGYATKAYEALGLWPYFLLIAAALFLIFTAISMTLLERLVEKGKIKRLSPVFSKAELLETVCSPGLWVLVIMFIIRACY